jgi:hypothetical protein
VVFSQSPFYDILLQILFRHCRILGGFARLSSRTALRICGTGYQRRPNIRVMLLLTYRIAKNVSSSTITASRSLAYSYNVKASGCNPISLFYVRKQLLIRSLALGSAGIAISSPDPDRHRFVFKKVAGFGYVFGVRAHVLKSTYI